MTKPTDKS